MILIELLGKKRGRMPYSIGLYFDNETESMVRAIWKQLADLKLADYFYISGNVPHITLGIFNVLSIDDIKNELEEISKSKRAFPISFQHIGIFQSSTNAVFWAPVVTQEFLEFHREFYTRILNTGATTESDYYSPGRLVPHCGLAMEVKDLRLIPQIVEVCLPLPNPHNALVTEIGMLKIRPVEHLFRFPFIG
jgi:2'-5' RNA ligase